MSTDAAVAAITKAARKAARREVDALHASFVATLTEVATERDALAARVAELEAQLGPRVIKAIDFTAEPLGPLTKSQVERLFGATVPTDYLARHRWQVVEDGGVRVLEGCLPGGTIDQSVWWCPLEPVEHATITTEMRLMPGFAFGAGGKLPGGLGGAVAGNPPTGGRPGDGFSTTPMFRTGGEAKGQPAGVMAEYVYHPKQAATYGDYAFLGESWPVGDWFSRSTEVRLNTPGHADGLLRSCVDGRVLVEDEARTWRTSDALRIDRIRWALFRGGNTLAWAVPTDSFVRIKTVTVTTPRVVS